MRTRQTRKQTIMENDGSTALHTMFNAGLNQHHQQMPAHTPQLPAQPPRPTSTQSATEPSTTDGHMGQGNRPNLTPPQANTVRMMETPVPMLPPAQYRPLTPCIPLPTSPNSGSHLSQLSASLFTEDRCSSISEEELEVDAEVTLINRRNKPNWTFMHNSTTGRQTSTPTTMDYTTQGHPNQVAPPTPLNMSMSTTTKNQSLGTNNFFIPDGSNRHIHDIHDKIFQAGYLENGNNANLLELPGLKMMLHTWKFLMDEILCCVWQQLPANVYKAYVTTGMGNRRAHQSTSCNETSFWVHRAYRTNTPADQWITTHS